MGWLRHIVIFSLWFCPAIAVAAPEPLTPEAAIQTARFMDSRSKLEYSARPQPVSVSPDKRWYVARIIRGDVARNGVWLEIIAGRVNGDSVIRPAVVARLFSTGLGGAGGFGGPARATNDFENPIRWTSGSRFTMLWPDSQGTNQVVEVDLTTGRIDWRTRSGSDVQSFATTSDGKTLYCAKSALDTEANDRLIASGFVIGEYTDVRNIMRGVAEGNIFDRLWNCRWTLAGANLAPRAVRIGGRAVDPFESHLTIVSPDQRLAIVGTTAASIQPAWTRYQPEFMSRRIASALRSPGSTVGRTLHQLFVVDLESGETRPLWATLYNIGRGSIVWSPDSRSLLIGPTYLPNADAEPAISGNAVAIVDVASGRFQVLPLDLSRRTVTNAGWSNEQTVELDVSGGGATTRQRFQQVGEGWVRSAVDSSPIRGTTELFELRQSLREPPRLYGRGVDGRLQMIWDPNPALESRIQLSTTERLTGTLAGGRRWSALVFFPLDYQPGRQYPLVIQSQYQGPFHGDTFSLYGPAVTPGTGPAVIAPYAGQATAARGMVVATIAFELELETPDEGRTAAEAYEGLIAQLRTRGLIDPARVGLVGFSRNGYFVEHVLTHSAFPYAVAVAVDNWEPGYFSGTLHGWGAEYAVNGSPPFGRGLLQWFENSPGFRAECVRTPLLMIAQGGFDQVSAGWEFFSRLRYLGRPVELYAIPDIDHGSHTTQNPRQILAVQHRVIDWLDFWLNGRDVSAFADSASYSRWPAMRLPVAEAPGVSTEHCPRR